MVAEREKEFEDGLFFGALASDQQPEEQAMLSGKQFAGIDLEKISIEKEELQNMSLKQFLVEQDKINFLKKSGELVEGNGESGPGSNTAQRKRKLDDLDMNNVGEESKVSKQRKTSIDGFLDCGSVSWSILLSIFFLSLHKGASAADSNNIDEDGFGRVNGFV